MTDALCLIADPAAASAALAPPRAAILNALSEPGSASSIARRLGLPRQRIAYHVRALEKHGLLEHVGDKRRGNCVERVLRATARQYLISPQALGAVGADPQTVRDRHSSAYLVATAARLAADVARLRQAADRAGKQVPTLTMETQLRFATPEDQQAFAEALGDAMADLIGRFHRADATDGRDFRCVVAAHPSGRDAARSPEAPAEDLSS